MTVITHPPHGEPALLLRASPDPERHHFQYIIRGNPQTRNPTQLCRKAPLTQNPTEGRSTVESRIDFEWDGIWLCPGQDYPGKKGMHDSYQTEDCNRD